MTDKGTKPYRDRIAAAVCAAAFWLVLWQILYMAVGKDYIVPSPVQTVVRLGELAVSAEFWRDVWYTLLRTAAGMFLSLICGLGCAMLAYRFSPVRTVLGSITSVFTAVPVMSVIMFAILFLISGTVPVFVCFMMCFPVFYTNILEGFDSVGEEYIKVCRLYTSSLWPRLRYVLLPMSRPYFKAALDLCSGLAWKTVIAAEVLASPKVSMGLQLLLAKTYFDAASLFAWTIAIVVLSVAFGRLVRLLLRLM